MEKGEVPVGLPVFVFFRLAGSYITDSAQMLSIEAAAELSVRENLLVRITGAADSATGSAEKNAALGKGSPRGEDRDPLRGRDNRL